MNPWPTEPHDQDKQPWVVLISGSHVTGKETLVLQLAEALQCPWVKSESNHGVAVIGARAQERRGYDYDQVYGRIWTSKLQRQMPSLQSRQSVMPNDDAPRNRPERDRPCKAVISCHAMRKPARDAIRHAMHIQGVIVLFAVLQISAQTLSGRTLGAEEPELAGRIMASKTADIEIPLEDERDDLFLLDEMSDVDKLFTEAMDGIEKFIRQKSISSSRSRPTSS